LLVAKNKREASGGLECDSFYWQQPHLLKYYSLQNQTSSEREISILNKKKQTTILVIL